jgi:hypothetical protein
LDAKSPLTPPGAATGSDEGCIPARMLASIDGIATALPEANARSASAGEMPIRGVGRDAPALNGITPPAPVSSGEDDRRAAGLGEGEAGVEQQVRGR